MAEILISLTIIGVIAAITLPALQANINEKTWATKRKALYSRMSQAISMMDSLNGYGVVFNENGAINEAETANKAAQAFVSDGLSKVLKINNICDNESLDKCGFSGVIKKFGKNAPKIATPKKSSDLNPLFNFNNFPILDTNAAAFETANGESVLAFYNPICTYDGSHDGNNYAFLMMCANFIYDLNGRKGPNQVGKDIGFITAFYPTDSEVVMPYLAGGNAYVSSSVYPQFSVALGNEACRKKYGNDTRMANIEELKSLWVNNNLGYYNSTYIYFFLPRRCYSSDVRNGKLYDLVATESGAGLIEQQDVIHYDGDGNKVAYCVK